MWLSLPVIESLHDVGQHRAVLPTAGPDGHVVPGAEEVCLADGVVDLSLECQEETILAQGVSGLRPLQDGLLTTLGTALHRHHGRGSQIANYNVRCEK